MTLHSKIGASSADRWFACPGSPALIEKAPPQETSKYAAQGTAAHWVLEECWPDQDPMDYEGMEAPNDYELKEEDCEAVAQSMEDIRELIPSDAEVFQEVRFNLTTIHEKLFGTCDFVAVSADGEELFVIDYKHGAGKPVEVKDNRQLLYYALGAIEEAAKKLGLDLDFFGYGGIFRKITIGVAQPRCPHRDGPFRTWCPSGNEINDFADELRERALATEKKDAPLHAGDHCKWCPAIEMCPAFREQTTAVAQMDFDDVSGSELADPAILSPEKLAEILDFEDAIKAFFEKAKTVTTQKLRQGIDVPGYKLVHKKTRRKWRDENEVIATCSELLGDDEIFDIKLKSPAQMEKALKKNKKIVTGLVYQPEGDLTLAPESDPREAVDADPRNEFDAIESKEK